MESKLAEYRARKEKERNSQDSIFRKLIYRKPKSSTEHISSTSHDEKIETQGQDPEVCAESSSKASLKEDDTKYTPKEDDVEQAVWVFYVLLVLKILLWLICWRYFIELGFGAVYFIISVSILMYINTRTGPQKKKQLSAYSVFNPNQERLDGTFTAEQFEKELRFGATSVK